MAIGHLHDLSHSITTDPFEHLDANEQLNKQNSKTVLILLNKVTAKTQEFHVSVNQRIIFEDLEIVILQCISNEDPYSTDKYLLVKVTEKKVSEDDKVIFEGWLVTNNPAVSNIEHPLYEIFAVNLSQF